MKPFVITICTLLLFVSGCGDTPDALMVEQIKVLNEFAAAAESGASMSELKEIEDRVKALAERMKAMDLSKEEALEIFERHKAEIELAQEKIDKVKSKMQSRSFR